MRLALYEPDIPQNTGTIIRLSACMNLGLDIIEPCGFPFSIKALRRSAMDYADIADVTTHESWGAFRQKVEENQTRLVLLTTKTTNSYLDFNFRKSDTLLFGRESAGVPDDVADFAHEKLTIPMAEGTRSLNIAVSAAMVVGEAIRQTRYSNS